MKTLPLPLSPETWAMLAADFPLTESAWDQMLALLETMKPALVTPDAPPPKTDDPTPSP